MNNQITISTKKLKITRTGKDEFHIYFDGIKVENNIVEKINIGSSINFDITVAHNQDKMVYLDR